jgi:ribosomal protein S18 acetylase RimI-like enzyme
MVAAIRPAGPGDGEPLGRMGAALARQHHDFDGDRFMVSDGIEEGYRRWLLKEAESTEAVVVVAELDGQVVGYGYGRLEGKDWNRLLDRHGELVDLWVEPQARKAGVGAALVEDVARRLFERGAPRLVLSTSSKNHTAQRLFTRLGFRPTMLEMTREAPGPPPAPTSPRRPPGAR